MKNERRLYHTIVNNHVALICDGSERHQWDHVSGGMNPGNTASWGLTTNIFLYKGHLLIGPEYLWKSKHVANTDRNHLTMSSMEVLVKMKVLLTGKQSCPLTTSKANKLTLETEPMTVTPFSPGLCCWKPGYQGITQLIIIVSSLFIFLTLKVIE